MAATILVPLDGSDKDERALAVAPAFANLIDGRLHLIHVQQTPSDEAAPAAGIHDAKHAAHLDDQRRLHATAEALSVIAKNPVTWEIARGADVAETLVRRAEELDAALVVMATRAPGAVGRLAYGSVADRVLRDGARDVVLVPPHAAHVAGRRLQIRRGLIPLDDSAAARDMVEWLLGLQRVGELEYELLQIVPEEHSTLIPAAEAALPHAIAAGTERRLEAIANRLRAAGARVDVRVVEANDPSAVISGAVRQDLVDFIAISTRGTRGLERWVLGSVATSVVKAAEVPVLLRVPKV